MTKNSFDFNLHELKIAIESKLYRFAQKAQTTKTWKFVSRQGIRIE